MLFSSELELEQFASRQLELKLIVTKLKSLRGTFSELRIEVLKLHYIICPSRAILPDVGCKYSASPLQQKQINVLFKPYRQDKQTI